MLKTAQWQYNIATKKHKLKNSEEFLYNLEKRQKVYALLYSIGFINVASMTFKLPPKLQSYNNVFSVKDANSFFVFKKRDHSININSKEPFYGPLYNLS